MTAPGDSKARRILVALDASPASAAACTTAAEIAATIGAELIGVFVEDDLLLRSAELPLTQLVGSHSAEILPFSSRDITSQLKVQAERARRAIATIAGRANVAWSFRISRGGVSTVLKQAAVEVDLVSVGSTGWSRHREQPVGTTLASLFGDSRGHILVTRQSGQHTGPIAIVLDSTSPTDELIEASMAFPRTAQSERELFIVAHHEATAGEVERTARAGLAARGLHGKAYWLGPPQPGLVARSSAGRGVLIMAARCPVVARDIDLSRFLRAVACPVLFVR
ncbi:MAG: universal stress protein [Proteobacteria bacterium]|nr:universal stress protein [Pseudomonadota bacterium]